MRYIAVLLLFFITLLPGVAGADELRHKIVCYKDFGAKGDGKTDDQRAIAAAHAFANKHKLPVFAEPGARYYIGSGSTVAVIKTDTDFKNAEFIIDDRNAQDYQQPIFRLEPDSPNTRLTALKSLKKSQTNLNMTFPGKVMLLLEDKKSTRFNRYRKNRPVQKSPQRDAVLVDEQGKLDPSTPLLWNFDNITGAYVHYIPEKTVTVKNAVFTTIDDGKSDKACYAKRNIEVLRSNVVFDNITHKVVESDTPHSYMAGGFLAIRDCCNVTVRNSAFTGDKRYFSVKFPENLSGGYDLTLWRAINVQFINCRQLNDIYNASYWGIIGTNYCRNLRFENCRFSRVDAHMGVYNVTIKNCTLGHQGISVTGFGTLHVEDSSVKSRYFIGLRADYGSFWQGRVIIRNSTFTPYRADGRAVPTEIIGGVNLGKHDFGYTCCLPETIEIDGLKVNDRVVGKDYPPIYLLANFNPDYKSDSYKEKYPVIKPKQITVKNLQGNSKKCIVSRNKYMFKKVRVVKK